MWSLWNIYSLFFSYSLHLHFSKCLGNYFCFKHRCTEMTEKICLVYSNALSHILKYCKHKGLTEKYIILERAWICSQFSYILTHKTRYLLSRGSASESHIEFLNYVTLDYKRKSADRKQKTNLNSFLAIYVTQMV